MGHGLIGSNGDLEDYLNKTDTERLLMAGMVRKARAWELEQLAKAISGKR